MKIIHLATVASSHRYLLRAQLRALVDAGHEVVAVSADGPDVEAIEHMGVRHVPLEGSTRGFDLRADLRAIRSFAGIVRAERPDLVHTHNPKPGVYGRVVARLLGVPVVVNTVHGLYATPDDTRRRRAVVYTLEAIASRFSHLELVQNPEDVELMVRLHLAPARRVRLLGNGVDIGRFRSGRDEEFRREVRAELGIDADAVIVASVGRLVLEKGFQELFEASARAALPHSLVVVGPEDPEKADAVPAHLIEAARDRGVRFLGHRSDIERLLPAFDVFVLPSHREGFPRAAMEAAASGLAIIASDVRGCRQVVDHGSTGYLVAKGDVDALARRIDELVRDQDLRRRFGSGARRKADREFDERCVVARVLASYAELTSPDR